MIIVRTVQRGSLSSANCMLYIYIYIFIYVYRPTFYLSTYYSLRYLNFVSFLLFFPLFSYFHLFILVFSLSLLPCLGPSFVYFYIFLSSFSISSLIYSFIFSILSFVCSLKFAVQTEVACVVPDFEKCRKSGYNTFFFILPTSLFNDIILPCHAV